MENQEREMLVNEMNRRSKKQKGVTTVEYAIMLALIAIAVAAAAPGISNAVVSVFSRAATCMNAVGSSC